jgi:DNA helicase HerA-like ATPase
LLIDLKDLRALLGHVAENATALSQSHGQVAPQSVGAIQRALLVLEQQGGDKFFGEPALDLADLMLTDTRGRGAVNVLAADKLMASPQLYATFLLWLLAELFEQLPEAGDLDKPKLVFFFDEAHLLFDDAPKALVDKVDQVVRLIRSKGVGVYFVTQSPMDLPESVLGQLGNRVQHALRAFTPKDQRAVRAAAETFRASPGLDTAKAIQELEIGEALVSLLDAKGAPTPVERALIRPPRSRLGPIDADERAAVMAMSPVGGRYDHAVDRESAFEQLQQASEPARETGGVWGKIGDSLGQMTNPWGAATGPSPAPTEPRSSIPTSAPTRPASRMPTGTARSPGRQRQGYAETAAKAVVRSVGSSIGSAIGRQIVRGILGSILK